MFSHSPSINKVGRLVVCVLIFSFLHAATHKARAHNPDTSYAKLEIGTERLELRLTYDLFTLSKITPIDDDGDHRVSKQELEGHLTQIQQFLSKSVILEIAGMTPGLGKAGDLIWPVSPDEAIHEKDFHAASSLVGLRFTREVDELPEDVTLTFKFFNRFGDRHAVLGKFVLNGVETEVSFNQFEPDFLFDTGYQPPLMRRLLKFCKLGVEHIFFGYDHICFLLALILVAGLKDMVRVITSFTLAHSITLGLATFDVVRLPSRMVEAAVAATIVYVALENVFRSSRPHRWALTFCFGLIHGFAFATVLENLSLPVGSLFRCLLSFNVGVELGQLAVVLLLLPAVMFLQRSTHARVFVRGASGLIALLGVVWFLERVNVIGPWK